MFSLFDKKKVTIKSISLPDPGWRKIKDQANIIQWINPEETLALSINYFGIPPDIPTIKDVNVLRQFYREAISKNGGGILELELYKHKQFDIIRSLIKIPQTPSGITYVGALTIPFSSCSFVLKVQAAEVGHTGIRETIVMSHFFNENPDADIELSWPYDPYDKDLKSGWLMNRAEDRRYDEDFPDHHLTLARKQLAQMEEEFRWEKELEKVPLLGK